MNGKKQWKKTTATKYRKDWNLDSDTKNSKRDTFSQQQQNCDENIGKKSQ